MSRPIVAILRGLTATVKTSDVFLTNKLPHILQKLVCVELGHVSRDFQVGRCQADHRQRDHVLGRFNLGDFLLGLLLGLGALRPPDDAGLLVVLLGLLERAAFHLQ